MPGFLTEAEARFIGMATAMAPVGGTIVEIGSFKGKSTVMLGTVAKRYSVGPVVAIDPHNFDNPELAEHRAVEGATSFHEFTANVERAGVSDIVEAHRAFSTDVAMNWSRPIRFLWIDGNHTYAGAKADFDGFMPYVIPGGIVAFHDALHLFSGPIRVFVEDVLRSDRFGAAGFVGSIAWAQYRPHNGATFREMRAKVERAAARLLPFVEGDRELKGLEKIRYKMNRALVPRGAMTPERLAELLKSSF